MDVTILVELVMGKFKIANGYSDFPEEEMKYKIEKWLEDEYKREVGIATFELGMEEKKNGFISKKRYEEKYDSIEETVILRAREMAAIDMEDLQNLVDPG